MLTCAQLSAESVLACAMRTPRLFMRALYACDTALRVLLRRAYDKEAPENRRPMTNRRQVVLPGIVTLQRPR